MTKRHDINMHFRLASAHLNNLTTALISNNLDAVIDHEKALKVSIVRLMQTRYGPKSPNVIKDEKGVVICNHCEDEQAAGYNRDSSACPYLCKTCLNYEPEYEGMTDAWVPFTAQ